MPLVINGETIDPALVDSEFGQIKAFYEQQANVSCCERDDEFLGYAKDNITARVLLSQAAQGKLERPSDTSIDQRIAELEDQAGGKEAFYQGIGISPDEVGSIRDEVASSLWLEQYLDGICGEADSPDENSILNYYDENLSSFTSAEEVRAAHIFKSLQVVEQREDLFEELRSIRRQLIAGEDFMKLAEAHSEKPIEEADLGFFKRGELMDEFELITFSLEVGDITPVFSTQWGMHLAKVTDRKLPRPLPIEDVREQIVEEMEAARRESKIQDHVEELKSAADIQDEPEAQDGDH